MNDLPDNPIERDSCGNRKADVPVREPQFHVEWAIAVMLGLGVALGGAAMVALEQAYRFAPEPSYEQGAKQWGKPKKKPEDTAAQTSGHQHAPTGDIGEQGENGGVWQDVGAADGQIANTGERHPVDDSTDR